MVQFTPQEEKALSKALWKAADGIKEMRKLLTDIGNRLGMEWRVPESRAPSGLGWICSR